MSNPALGPEEIQELSRLLDRALDLSDAEREAWLRDLGGPQARLAPTLRRLLAAQGDGGPGLTLPRLAGRGPVDADDPAHDDAARLRPGTIVGPYRLIRELGRGGMGFVWLAERIDGSLKRQVALKLPRHRLSERFARERDILAGLVHAHIARLYDAGTTAEGQPYLAMEYVEGEPLTAWSDARRLNLKARIALFQQVLAAVDYAHRHRVIHRDLKPSNILVTGEGEVRLLDFGIAKLMAGAEAGGPDVTRIEGRALSPRYASPEQILDEPLGNASDVYSLGVVLYELLTGSFPCFRARDLSEAIEHGILNVESIRASDTVADAALALARGTTARELRTALRGDLDAILRKALSKDPAQRYATARAFSEDLDRWLHGKPVLAQPDSPWYRALKFLGRNRLTAGTAIVAALAGLLGAAAWMRSGERGAPASAEPPAMSLTIASFGAPAGQDAAARIAELLPRELTTVLVACCHELKVISDPGKAEGTPGHRGNAPAPPAGRYRVNGDVLAGKEGDFVSLRLVEANTGAEAWSTRFDLPELDGSPKSSARMRKLAALLADAVKSAETRRVLARPPDQLDAMGLALRAYAVWKDGQTLEKTLEAQKLYNAALRLDPNLVYALLMQAANWDLLNDVDPHIDRDTMLRQMNELTSRAINLDPTDPHAWAARAGALADAGRWSGALEAIDRRIGLDPFSAAPYEYKAWLMNMSGRPAEALPLLDRALGLDPESAGWAMRFACEAYLLMGRFDSAVSACEKAAGTNSDWFITSYLAAAYANRGDLDKARAARDAILRTVPGYTIAQIRAKHYSDAPEYLKIVEDTWYEGLRKAGIPER